MKTRSGKTGGAAILAGVMLVALGLGFPLKSSAAEQYTLNKTCRMAKAEKLKPKQKKEANAATDVFDHAKLDDMIAALHKEVAKFNKVFDSLFDDEFFEKAVDPFKEMDDYRKELASQFKKLDFEKDHSFSDTLFNSWFANRFGSNYGDIQKKEDQKYVYYQFKVDNPKNYRFTTRIHDGKIELSAEDKTVTQKEKEGYQSKTVTDTKMERSFPLPKNVNADKYQTEIKDDQYIVRFPKTS